MTEHRDLPGRALPEPKIEISTLPPRAEASEGSGPRYENGYPGWSRGTEVERRLSVAVRYKWLILAITLVGTAAGLSLAYWTKPQYLVQATLWIEARESGRIEAGRPIQSAQLLSSYNWVDLLTSYAVLENVTREARLYLRLRSARDSVSFAEFQVAPDFQPGEYRLVVDEKGGGFELWLDTLMLQRGSAGDSIGVAQGFHWAASRRVLQRGTTLEFRLVPPRDAATELAEQLETRLLENGNFLRVELRGSNPRATATILEHVIRRFVMLATDLKRAKLEELRRLLEEQLQSAEANLRRAESQWEQFRVQTVTVPLERSRSLGGERGERDPVVGRYFELRLEADELRGDREAIEEAVQASSRSGVPVNLLEAIPAVRNAAELGAALKELTERRAELRALGHRYGEGYPSIVRLEQQVQELEREVIPAYALTLARQLKSREQAVLREASALSSDLRGIPPQVTQDARLQRQVTMAEGLYTSLQTRYDEARLAELSALPDVRVLDPPEIARRPVSDPRARIVILAFAGSFVLGVFGAMLYDRLDPRLRYPEQVSEEMGIPILGAVPHLAIKKGRAEGERTGHALEAFRAVRLNLSYAYGAAGPLITTVTSPGIGDGKSFVSLNLAMAFGQLGYRTLLIDADVRRGRLHRPLELPRRPGLTDLLGGQAALDAVVQRTPHGALDFIGCGTRMKNGPGLLPSPVMGELIAQARSRYAAIIIDSPPLGAGVDPLVLATFTGNLLLVFRAGTTNRGLAEAKLQLVTPLPVRIVGAVFNDVPTDGIERYHTYYLSGYEVAAEGDEPQPSLLAT